MELELQPEFYRHKFTRRRGQQAGPGGLAFSFERVIWEDFTLAAPIGSRQLALQAVPNCVMIAVQHSASVSSPSIRPIIYLRDGTINNPAITSLQKGIEIQVGQILTIEADAELGEFLNPLEFSVIGVFGPNIVHVAYGVKLT